MNFKAFGITILIMLGIVALLFIPAHIWLAIVMSFFIGCIGYLIYIAVESWIESGDEDY